MSQNIIDTGQAANDGTGEPLRQAFTAINNNFSQIWESGPVNSNVQITDNRILTLQTNQNLVLSPDGIGDVQANSSVVPNLDHVRDLGNITNRWDTLWVYYVDTEKLTMTGDLTVGGNLSVVGNIIDVGNVTTDTKVIHIANTAGDGNAANGAGIVVGANSNIATFLYDAGNNTWTTNIGVTANFFVGDGSRLSNINPGNIDLANLTSTISTTGNISGNYFIGDGSLLTGLPAGYANADAVAYGAAGWAGNIVPAANNVYSLGNSTRQWSDLYVSNSTIYINNVPIGLTAGNVLTVNGNDVVVMSNTGEANLGNLTFEYATIRLEDGAAETTIDISPNIEGYAYVQLPNDATANTANVRIHNDIGNVEISAGGDYWYFGNGGNLTFPDNSGSGWPINQQRFGMGNIGAWLDGQWTIGEFSGSGVSGQVGIRIDPGIEGNTGITLPSQADSVTQPVTIYNYGGGNVKIDTNYSTSWTFDTNGLLTLPSGNVTIGSVLGGDAILSNNVPFGVISQGNTGATVVQWSDDVANTSQLSAIYVNGPFGNVGDIQVRSGNVSSPNVWTFDTTGALNLTNFGVIRQEGAVNVVATDYAQLQWVDAGNINIPDPNGSDGPKNWAYVDNGGFHVETNLNNGGSSYAWDFDTNGNFTTTANIAGGNVVAISNFVGANVRTNLTDFNWSESITGIATGATTVVTLANNVFGDPWTGQVTISGVSGATEANATWWYQAVDSNQFALYTDNTLSTPVDSSAWGAYVSGGFAITLDYGNIEINAETVTIRSDHGDYNNKIWSFNSNGSTIFPTLTVDLHNGGNQSAQTLQFGDPSQQAVITGPTPSPDTAAQRLIIQGQRGNGLGEGGDVYVWAGDAEFNGGDIKIYAGDADDGSAGSGGYINLDGGSGFNGGGQISITGGYSPGGQGGPVYISAGQGTDGGVVNINGGGASTATGGYVNIQGGFGQGDGGAVTIAGGGSALGLPGYGNVQITAGVSTWSFDNTGNLTLPTNTFTVNYANGTPVSIGGNYGDSNVATFLAAYGSNTVSTTGNITAGNFVGSGSNVDIVAGAYDWTFDATGNLTLPSNTFAVNYANGVAVSLGGNYGNSNVATLLAAFGSNTVVTTGNITGGNFLTSGLISATGNITGGNLITAGTFQSASISSTGNITSGNGSHVILGNATSALRQNASNATVKLDGSVTLTPDTSASALNGVIIGGNGYLLAANGARVLTLGTNNALTVAGNLALGGSTGYSQFTTLGTTTTGINAVLAGPTFTPLANTSAGFVANVNNYTQITFQNKSTGADATADYILTADNGSDTVNYGDFGIINSGYDNSTPTNSLGNIVFAADTYIYAQGNVSNTAQSGGNLVIGTATAGKTVKIFAGGNTASALIANISNTGISVTGNVTASNFIGNISITGNVVGTSANVSLVAGSYTATFDNTGILTLPSVGGDEGGEINLGIPATNTTLLTAVKFDVYQDRIRFFDGSTKGVYIDLSQAATGVSTLLNNRVSGYVNAGTYVTMDNLKATVSTSGNRSLQIAAVSGSFSAFINASYAVYSGGTGGTGASLTVTTTPVLAIAWNFTGQGDTATYIINDTTNSRCYRVTMMIGGSYNNNMIAIERLV